MAFFFFSSADKIERWLSLTQRHSVTGKLGLRVPLSTAAVPSHGFSLSGRLLEGGNLVYVSRCLQIVRAMVFLIRTLAWGGGILVCVSRCSHICPKKNKTKFLPFYYTMQFAGFFNCLLLLFWTFEYINITCTTLRESHLLPPFTRASLFSCLWVNYYNSLLFFLTPTRYPYPVPLRLHLEKKKQTFSYPVPLRSKKKKLKKNQDVCLIMYFDPKK